jgi:isocitrate dehydrogenase (NAD+)
MKKVTLIPGDGIGPEIVESVKKIFEAAGVQIEWEEMDAGITAFEKHGEVLPDFTLESIRFNKVALKAPLTTPVGKGFRSVNVQLRKELDLYANVRPIISLEGVNSPLKKGENIDLVIVRENTEDLYSGIEHMVGDDAAESIKIITRKASERIAHFAFNVALDRKKDKSRITVVHKANIMKFTDGLFLESANKIINSKKEGTANNRDKALKCIGRNPDEKLLKVLDKIDMLQFDDRIVDNMCMQLVQRPETFDVILAPNLYGDIISDLCAALVGGLGVAPGANIGDECAVYEAIHGTAPDIAGQNKANPTSLLLSATMMLRDKNIEDFENADRIERAIKLTLKEGGEKVTGDLGGTATTTQFTDFIIDNLDK